MDTLIPVLTSNQTRECENFTRLNEPISNTDLMERASWALYNAIAPHLSQNQQIHVLCGPGNNGGDGLCIARILISKGFDVQISLCLFGKKQSIENAFQQSVIEVFRKDKIKIINDDSALNLIEDEIILDCLFGSGLSSELNGGFANVVNKTNQSGALVYSIDIPSGLFDYETQGQSVFINANKTFSIQSPKPSFFYAENKIDFEIVNAGIQTDKSIEMKDFFLSPQQPYQTDLLNSIPAKPKFSHKGTFGHALLVGGNHGMHGAVAMASKSCISAGAGLTTVFAPAEADNYMAKIPAVMRISEELCAESLEKLDLSKYTVLAVGPGLGNTENTKVFLESLLIKWNKPVLLDADALNIVAENKQLWNLIQANSIVTPHPGEFSRIFGKTENDKEKFQLAREMAVEKQIYILAKNTYSALFTPEGTCFYNGSGGPWLAQGGSGDTLTGLVAGLWARTEDTELAAKMGMYMAGL